MWRTRALWMNAGAIALWTTGLAVLGRDAGLYAVLIGLPLLAWAILAASGRAPGAVLIWLFTLVWIVTVMTTAALGLLPAARASAGAVGLVGGAIALSVVALITHERDRRHRDAPPLPSV